MKSNTNACLACLLPQAGRRIKEETGEPLSLHYLHQRIAVAIQRGNAATVLGTSPPRDTDPIFLDKPTNFAWEHTQVCSALTAVIYILVFYLQFKLEYYNFSLKMSCLIIYIINACMTNVSYAPLSLCETFDTRHTRAARGIFQQLGSYVGRLKALTMTFKALTYMAR